jgi:ferredoxin
VHGHPARGVRGGDDDFLYILNENPPEEQRAKLEEAVQRCPKQAIAIEG